MSGESIHGFSIPISGETKELRKSLKVINDDVRNITQETNALRQSLNNNWTMETFVRAQAAAKEAVSVTEEKVKSVKIALSELGDADTEKAKEKIKLLSLELIKAETAANKAKKNLSEIAGSEFKNNLTKANGEIDLTKRKLDALATGLSIRWDKSTFTQAQAAAREAVDKTNDKVKVLQTELDRLEKDGSTDKNQAEFQELSAQIVETKVKAMQAEKQLADINEIKFDRVTSLIGKLGDSMIKGGAVLTAGVTLPLAYVGKQALETASALTEVQNVVDVSFKDGAKAIDEWSKSLLESNGISELTAKQYAGLYKSMANGMGVANDAGTEMSVTMTEMIADVSSFKNISLESAGTKLKSIFTGETESLIEIGVVMTEANVNAFALSHGMEQLSDDMDQSEKVALRYKFVMDALKDAHGDFGRTLETSLANQTRLAQEQFKSLSVELAKELLPIATDILKWANETMKAFSGMNEEQKKTTLVVIGLAAALGPATTLLGGVFKAVELTRKGITAFKVANNAAAVSQQALNVSMSLNPVYLLAAALAAVTIGIVTYTALNDDAAKKQKELTEALNETTEAHQSNLSTIENDAQSKRAELDVADKLIERYNQLNEKVNKTSVEKEVLQNTVRDLAELLGIEITLIDSENLKYDATTVSLKNLTQARREEIVQIANRNRAIKAQEAMLDLEQQKADAIANIKSAREERKAEPFNDDLKMAVGIDSVKDAEEHLKNILDEEKEIQKQIDSYTNDSSIFIGSSTAGMMERQAKGLDEKTNKPRTLTPEQKVRNDELMEEEKGTLNARMGLDMYSEQVYYEKLKALRTTYYGDQKKDVLDMTKAEMQLNRDIHSQEVAFAKKGVANTKTYTAEQTKAYKEMYDNQKNLAKDAYDQNKKLLKSEYDESKKKLDEDYKDEISRIDNVLKRKEQTIDAAINAIDKEIDARKRLKESTEFNTQIDSLKAQLSYGKMDDFTRKELEAELKRIEEEKADYAWELEQTDRKAALNEELANAKEKADRQKANLQEMLEINKTAIEETYNLQLENLETAYQMHTAQLESMFNTSSVKMGEISSAFVGTISKGVEDAARKLSALIGQTNSAANRAASPQSYASYDNSQRSANVNVYGSNLTGAQVQGQIDRALDRAMYR